MNPEHRAEIVGAFTQFEDNDFAKVFDKWNFYYNKQSIMLTNVDEDGNSIDLNNKKSIKLNPSKLTYDLNDELHEIKDFLIEEFEDPNCQNLKEYYDKVVNLRLRISTTKNQTLKWFQKV